MISNLLGDPKIIREKRNRDIPKVRLVSNHIRPFSRFCRILLVVPVCPLPLFCLERLSIHVSWPEPRNSLHWLLRENPPMRPLSEKPLNLRALVLRESDTVRSILTNMREQKMSW